ncbi:unnamed protein product [Polarella glacialis]|uniref:Fe2OG dioxygenase domain-containing protein n=1 Tax=Polarella glacialis TaxID=89957 RepID=A0A813GMI4_POLGL|nr:unnamed protein product [Polarella glacialis]CAE8627802.1 unnamed protein product [Polarella glacialis]
MPSAGTQVPVVDIAPFRAALGTLRSQRQGADRGGACAALPEDARRVAQQWREAFSTYGFCQVTGHGVPDDAIEAAYGAARRFFSLPAEGKLRCDLGKGYGFGGFTAQGKERVSATASEQPDGQVLGSEAARPPDRVESMVVYGTEEDLVPSGVEGYKDAVHGYHDGMKQLLKVVMALTACSLDLDFDYFEPFYASKTAEGSLRLAYYPAFEEGQEPLPKQLRYGEHTDYTGFTLLWQDHNVAGLQTATDLRPPQGGLQVRMPDGSFVDCPPMPGAFTVNAGDLIQVWTNDVFLSNVHRVVNPPPGDRNDRISMVFFTGPAADTVVEALPTCVGPRQPAKYAPVTAGEHLQKKLFASNK